MRIKISFNREKDSPNTLPLHHQNVVSGFVYRFITRLGDNPGFYNFSTLKGTSRIKSGSIIYLSSKVSIALAGIHADFIKKVGDAIVAEEAVEIGKMKLVPKAIEVVQEPRFEKRMKYLCISPLIADFSKNITESSIHPAAPKFSDLLFNSLMDNMEKTGIENSKLNEYAEFAFVPDKDYLNRMEDSGKKFVRMYKDPKGNSYVGYLLPFTLHAHPEVHRFIWYCGLGMLNTLGYGMIDLAGK